jgi:hypothetical protein
MVVNNAPDLRSLDCGAAETEEGHEVCYATPKWGDCCLLRPQKYTPGAPVVQVRADASSGLNPPHWTQQIEMLDSKCAKPAELRHIGARSFLLR